MQEGLQSQKFNCFTLHIINIFKSHTYFYSNLTYNRFDVCLLWRLLVADTVVSHESSNMFNATYMSRPINLKRNIMPIVCCQSATYLVGCQNKLFCAPLWLLCHTVGKRGVETFIQKITRKAVHHTSLVPKSVAEQGFPWVSRMRMIKFPATRRQHELIMINTSCKRKRFLDPYLSPKLRLMNSMKIQMLLATFSKLHQ